MTRLLSHHQTNATLRVPELGITQGVRKTVVEGQLEIFLRILLALRTALPVGPSLPASPVSLVGSVREVLNLRVRLSSEVLLTGPLEGEGGGGALYSLNILIFRGGEISVSDPT